jgi:N-acetyl-gamma-glutamyl-phosphate reductase
MIVGVIGATGYAGAELVRLLSGHPKTGGMILSSVSFEGERIENIYPNFLGKISAALVKPEEVCAGSDVVFAALPHGVGEPFAKACLERGIPFIDLSADYRFDGDEATFRAWYGKPYVYPELREHSVYGLPELNRPRIKELAAAGRVIIGNPGCYPTGASLGVFPAITRGLAAGPDGAAGCPAVIIVDSASGITGGGREPSRSFHFPECSDSLTAYKVGSHRHTPEISRNFAVMAARAAGSSAAEGRAGPAAVPGLIFTPHLAPINRGILSTIYIPLAPAWRAGGLPATGEDSAAGQFSASAARPPSGEPGEKTEKIRALYADFYREEPFVRVLPAGLTAATNRVRQSNYCDISVHLDQTGTTLIIVSAIDNMVKGAAGQALQNMNIVMGFDERAGLEAAPALF